MKPVSQEKDEAPWQTWLSGPPPRALVRRERTRRAWVLGFGCVSLLLHLLLAWIVYRVGSHALQFPPASKPREVVEVSLVPSKPRKIADLDPPLTDAVPEHADIAALYNQKVKTETVARSPIAAPHGQAGEGAPPRAPKRPRPQPADREGTSALGMPPDKTAPAKPAASRFGKPGFSEDFFPDYKVGAHTYVNALRYPNISYFVELKRRFTTAFNPVRALRANRAALAGRSIEVVLGVTADSHGNLSEGFVIRPSAISEYDDTALRAVRSSAPFRSPPSALLDETGLLRMSWTFTVYF